MILRFENIDFLTDKDRPPYTPISFIRLKVLRFREESDMLCVNKIIAVSENKEMDAF